MQAFKCQSCRNFFLAEKASEWEACTICGGLNFLENLKISENVEKFNSFPILNDVISPGKDCVKSDVDESKSEKIYKLTVYRLLLKFQLLSTKQKKNNILFVFLITWFMLLLIIIGGLKAYQMSSFSSKWVDNFCNKYYMNWVNICNLNQDNAFKNLKLNILKVEKKSTLTWVRLELVNSNNFQLKVSNIKLTVLSPMKNNKILIPVNLLLNAGEIKFHDFFLESDLNMNNIKFEVVND